MRMALFHNMGKIPTTTQSDVDKAAALWAILIPVISEVNELRVKLQRRVDYIDAMDANADADLQKEDIEIVALPHDYLLFKQSLHVYHGFLMDNLFNCFEMVERHVRVNANLKGVVGGDYRPKNETAKLRSQRLNKKRAIDMVEALDFKNDQRVTRNSPNPAYLLDIPRWTWY